jgi:hypothetical protein
LTSNPWDILTLVVLVGYHLPASLLYFIVVASWSNHSIWYMPVLQRLGLVTLLRVLQPFRMVHGYGIFFPKSFPPVKNTPVFEGSNDGVTWQECVGAGQWTGVWGQGQGRGMDMGREAAPCGRGYQCAGMRLDGERVVGARDPLGTLPFVALRLKLSTLPWWCGLRGRAGTGTSTRSARRTASPHTSRRSTLALTCALYAAALHTHMYHRYHLPLPPPPHDFLRSA